MTRREYIATFAITRLLRGAGTYRSLAEALAYREDAVSLILNRTPVTDDVGPLQNLRSLILNANDLEVLPPGIERLNDLRAIFIGSARLDFRRVIIVAPARANVPVFGPYDRSRDGRWALRMRFSAARYSLRSNNS